LAKAGMDVARLNFSHGTYTEHKKQIKLIRKVATELEKPIAILQDLQGLKIRVHNFEKGFIHLKSGESFVLTTRKLMGDKKIVSVSYDLFHQDVSPGDTVLLDDGLLKLEVEKISGQDVHCKVIFGGKLANKKGINLPSNVLSVDTLSEKDIKDLEFGLESDVDYIALSFVQKPEDIKTIKKLILEKNKNIPVVAKIEKPQAVRSLSEIASVSDAIMVARGDLGVEVNAEEVPPLQKQIISLCN
jgi:pyruvate kinase